MNQSSPTNPDEDIERDQELEAEVLIGRIIDSEAGDEDRARFEYLAASEPTLWRQLALRQQDTDLLAEKVCESVAAIERIDLPRRWLFPERLSWPLALAGWAAVFIISLSWSVVALVEREANPSATPQPAVFLTPEEHYEQYRAAPYVIGEMTPEVVDVQALSDGRLAIHLIRKTEEVALLDPTELPVDENGELTSNLTELRKSEPPVGLPE